MLRRSSFLNLSSTSSWKTSVKSATTTQLKPVKDRQSFSYGRSKSAMASRKTSKGCRGSLTRRRKSTARIVILWPRIVVCSLTSRGWRRKPTLRIGKLKSCKRKLLSLGCNFKIQVQARTWRRDDLHAKVTTALKKPRLYNLNIWTLRKKVSSTNKSSRRVLMPESGSTRSLNQRPRPSARSRGATWLRRQL